MGNIKTTKVTTQKKTETSSKSIQKTSTHSESHWQLLQSDEVNLESKRNENEG